MRTLAEEAGITTCETTCMSYVDFSRTLMGEECRDSRYGVLLDGYKRVYGYPRVSTAHTMVCVFECSPPENPVPKDRDECSKPTIVPVSVAKEHFRVGGKFSPAFPAHVQQMNACMHMIGE